MILYLIQENISFHFLGVSLNLSSYVYCDSKPQKKRDYMSKKKSIVQE